jgi:hypothetical protein
VALTEEGRALTEAHRVEQLRISIGADRQIRDVWRHLKMSDLDRSTPYWTARMLRLLAQHYKTSQNTAAEYLDAYRTAELGFSAGPIERPPMDLALATVDLRIAGPVALKKDIGRGITAESAYYFGVNRARYSGQQIILAGGRNLIDNSARANRRSGRYRRVTDGYPCTFCAMLVSRGPVYSETTAYFRSHKKCGCTAEEVIGEWEPTELESRWVASYEDAAKAADLAGQSRIAPKPGREEDNILWRMRRNSPSLFHDGVVVAKPRP